ncbi:MAG: sugar phosphate isomerase/epimerase [Anaerolineae bacterium]|nr:sugar phosphate isomerase/epimerase [Anaerolineae bacterium]
MEIGVISYLLRHHGTADAMDFLSGIGYTVTELDFRHADGLTDYHKVDAKGAAETRKLCIAHGITPMAYCVGGLSKGRDAAFLRNVFEFAKGLEVPVITGVLDPALLPDLDELCEEYRTYYAIENHRGNVFEAADTILQALEGHSLYIGANPDTGHFAAAGVDPLAQVEKLAGRIYHVHFKDSDQRLPLGGGTVDLPGVYKELKRQGFDRLLSIEHNEYDGIPDDALRLALSHDLGYIQGLSQAKA